MGAPGRVDQPLDVGGGVLTVEDEHLDRAGGDLVVDGGLVGGSGVVALADGVEEGRRGHQVEAEGLRHGRHDALRRADRPPGVAGPDLGDDAVVGLQGDVDEVLVQLIEVGGVGRPEGLVVGRDPVDHGVDVGRRVPPMGVVTVLQARRGRPRAARRRAGAGLASTRFVDPRVVAEPVADHVAGGGHAAGVGGGRLVVVGIGGGVVDQAADLHPVASELGGDAPPEVLRRHHRDRAGGARRRRGGAAGRRQEEGEHRGQPADDERVPIHIGDRKRE